MRNPPCCICEGRETVESLVRLHFEGTADQYPACAAHYTKCEECLRATLAIRTPPVNVYCSGLRVGALPRDESRVP